MRGTTKPERDLAITSRAWAKPRATVDRTRPRARRLRLPILD